MAETTAAIIITPAVRFYAGVSAQLGDQNLRERALFAAQQAADRLNQLAPVWWRHANGTVSVALNQTYGTMPADFSHLDQDSRIYINGVTGRPPLRFLDPAVLRDRIQRDSSVRATYPEFYTLEGRTAAGIPQIRVADAPSGNVTLDVLGYVKRAPQLVDVPIAPSLAASVSAGSPSGAYTGRATFVITGSGETEGGIVTSLLSVTAKQISWAGIPVPPEWLIGRVLGRNLYRTAAGGVQHKLLTASLAADVLTTTFTDNVADGALGANVPTPATAVGTGIEQFPIDWQRTMLYEYTKASLAQGQGDVRDNAWFAEWEENVRRYWAELKQDATKLRAMPKFRQRPAIERPRSYRERLS